MPRRGGRGAAKPAQRTHAAQNGRAGSAERMAAAALRAMAPNGRAPPSTPAAAGGGRGAARPAQTPPAPPRRAVVTPPPRDPEPIAQYVRNIEQDNEERLECKICLDAPRAVRFQKCGHCCVCTDCYNELLQLPPEHRKCPLCNVHIGDAHSVLKTQAALQTFMASRTRGTNRQQRRAAEQRKDKAQRVRKLSHAEEKKALQRGRRTPLADGATLLEYKGLYAVLESGQRTTPFVKPPPVLPAAAAPAPPRPPAPRSAAAADLLLRAAVGAVPPPRPVPPAYELRTSEFTLVSHAHGRERRAERSIQRRELQAAIKYGEKVAAARGRWRFTHQGVVYITDETMRHEITSWRLDGGAVPPPQRWAGPPLAAHYVVIVDHSGSMNAKDCLDDCGGKITRLEAAYDTLLNSYMKKTRENAPDGKDIVVSLVTMSTKAECVFERYRLGLAEDAISNHAKVAYAHDHGNYLPALAEVERLFSQPIDAEGSHALGVVLLTDGKPSDTVTDPRFVSPVLRGYDRIIAQLSWLLRDLEQKVDERFPRFACNLLGIGASRAEFKILDDVNADIKRGSVDHSALDLSLLSSTMTSMATTMMSSVLETSVCAGRAKRTVREVAQESADAADASSPRRPAAATDPFDAALPFLTPAQRRNFVENDVTLDCLALLHEEDLDELLQGDAEAKSSFRMRYPDPAAAAPSVEEAAEMARAEVQRIRAEEEALEDARALSLGEKLDVKDPHWLFSEPVDGATLWNGERLAWRDFDAPRILAKRRKYFSDGAERLAYRGALVEPDTAVILEDVVFKESKFEEDHVVVKQEDESDDSDDDDDDDEPGRLAGFAAAASSRFSRAWTERQREREEKQKGRQRKREEKEEKHSVYHISFCKAQSEAALLAVEFNAATKRWGRLPRVTFVTSSVYKFAARVGVQGGLETTRVLGEPRLRGEYKKFTNNAGKSADFPGSDMDCGPVVEPKQRAQPQQGLFGLGAIGEEDEEDESDDEPEHLTAGEVPQAFSHFSYEFSSGARMVCDLQGCFSPEGGFQLTDPCMLSKVGRSESGYGRTDRGLHGLVDFFRTHKCTPLCKALGLTDARVREQELVVEEALRKKEEREASRAAAERAAEAEKQKRRQAKEAKRERRAAEIARRVEAYNRLNNKARQKKYLEDLSEADRRDVLSALERKNQEDNEFLDRDAAENRPILQRATGAVRDRVGGAASLLLGKKDSEDIEDRAAAAGFPRSKEGVQRYQQSVRDREQKAERAAAKEAEKAELERKRVLRKDAEEAKRVAKVAVAAMKQRERLLQAKLRAGVAMSQKDRAEAQQLELDARIEERRKQELKEASGRDLLQACLNTDSDSDDEPPPGWMALD